MTTVERVVTPNAGCAVVLAHRRLGTRSRPCTNSECPLGVVGFEGQVAALSTPPEFSAGLYGILWG